MTARTVITRYSSLLRYLSLLLTHHHHHFRQQQQQRLYTRFEFYNARGCGPDQM